MPTMIVKLRVRFVVEPDDEGFHVFCPDLKGLHAMGSTEDEALQNGRRAVELYFQSLIKHNDPLPIGVQDGAPMTVWAFIKERLAAKFGPKARHSVLEEIKLCPA